MFRRVVEGETLLAAFNLSSEATSLSLPEGSWTQLDVPGQVSGTATGSALVLPGYAVFFARQS
jgi:alpha-glucosidase